VEVADKERAFPDFGEGAGVPQAPSGDGQDPVRAAFPLTSLSFGGLREPASHGCGANAAVAGNSLDAILELRKVLVANRRLGNLEERSSLVNHPCCVTSECGRSSRGASRQTLRTMFRRGRKPVSSAASWLGTMRTTRTTEDASNPALRTGFPNYGDVPQAGGAGEVRQRIPAAAQRCATKPWPHSEPRP